MDLRSTGAMGARSRSQVHPLRAILVADLKYRFHVKGTNDTRIEVFPSGMSVQQVRQALEARYGGPGMVTSVFYVGTVSSGETESTEVCASTRDSDATGPAVAGGLNPLLMWVLVAFPQLCVAGVAAMWAARWGVHHHIQPATGWITALLLLAVAAAAYAIALIPIRLIPRQIYAVLCAAVAAVVASVYGITRAEWGQYVQWLGGQMGDYAGYARIAAVGGVLLALLLAIGFFWLNHKMHSDAFGWHQPVDEA